MSLGTECRLPLPSNGLVCGQPLKSNVGQLPIALRGWCRFAVITADFSPWISSVRRQVTPCWVMPPGLFLPPLECCLGVNPIQASNCAPFPSCLKPPTVATTAEAVTGPMPNNVAAACTAAVSLA